MYGIEENTSHFADYIVAMETAWKQKERLL